MPDFLKGYGTKVLCEQALKVVRWTNGFSFPHCRHRTQGDRVADAHLFRAIYLFSQANTGVSALALKRSLDVSHPSAWLIHHKLMQVMANSEGRYLLEGKVHLDDAYLGSEVGRGSEKKVAFVGAVSPTEEDRPLRVRLTPVPSFTRKAVAALAKGHLAPESTVLPDGLARFGAATATGCLHQPTIIAGCATKAVPQFKWVNTVRGNLKFILSGC